MQARTVERIEAWGTRPFSGGVDGLRELADEGFSGAIDAGPWVFMLNGRVVGVVDGSLDDVGPGTAYVAAHDSLPLLFVMLERGGERRGQYYTGETPIAEVDATLREGGFTGYLELSENVLSGDYYLVYYGGERRACAYIGQAERLETGEEAYERAVDEVGIYTVTAVDVGTVDLPGTGGVPGGGASAASTGPTAGDAEPDDAGTASARTDAEPDDAPAADRGAESASTGDAAATGERAGAERDRAGGGARGDAGGDARTGGGAQADAGNDREADPLRSENFPGVGDDSAPAAGTDADAARSAADASSPSPSPATAPAETDLRPAVLPATGPPPETPSGGTADADASATTSDAASDAGEAAPGGDASSDAGASGRAAGDEAAPPAGSAAADAAAVGDLEARVDALREERADLEAETDRLREELAAVREERDGLEAEVRRLEERIRDLEADPGAERTLALDPEEALAGTSLFVRYENRSGATLSDALAGDADADAVGENLALEHHTTFDDAAASVDDRPFEAFLEDTLEYEVAAWLVDELPYEIAETGHVDDLGALYEALPEIDRIEFRGAVETDDGDVEFDVVCRDRLGTPLVVIDLHDSRDPAGDTEMEALLESADAVAEATESVAGAVMVTASFFDPQALETAAAATDDGGLLGGSRTSFVRLSRRVGYHLCLVEARDRRFHVAMPEL